MPDRTPPLAPRRGWLALLAALCLCAASPAALDSPIGFRVLERRDPTRPLPDSTAGRPIQIALWYPAGSATASDSEAPMLYRDYMALGLSEKSFAKPSAAATERMAGEYRRFLESTGVPELEADALLSTRMRAVRDAPAAPGGFPLILLAPGNGQSADDMASFAERLAGRGFWVASVPSPTRISGPMQTEADIPVKADEQAADLAFAQRALRSEARLGRTGVVGHSFGARSALLCAMRDPEVAAIVSLDGGIGSRAGIGMLEKAPGFSRERMAVPLLHFYEELDAQMAPDFGLIRSLDRSDRWLVRVADMRHVHFTSMGALVTTAPALSRATGATPQTEEAWSAVVEATASFLDGYLNRTGSKTPRWQVPASRELRAESLPASR
jgi:dienelactone hydrolase